ncbi:MAG: Gfo/Idh/MocA family oxidoreductase [Thermoflavifilum sp.]|nr:Gfo/Idh/MocA family oxidoreductase [Thermoflavifilum sp.]MCL6513009.1 Gfo/Idh/MocA family oxidoreductase [Alicyclobacillus sp.]
MAQDSRVGIGIIGAGSIAELHLQTLHALAGDAEVVAIADVNLEAAHARAATHQIRRVYDSTDDLVRDSEVDAVIVALPNRWHADAAVAALSAGKAVLLEKPMAYNVAQAARIVEAQRSAKRPLMMAHQMRWTWPTLEAVRLMEQGALGRVYHAHAAWLRRKGIPGWGSWFTRRAEAGGGPVMDLGVHMLDLTLHLLGWPQPVAVSAATYAELGPRRKGIGGWGTPDWDGVFDVEDFAVALIRLEHGSTIELQASWAGHLETDNQPKVELLGAEGGVQLSTRGGHWRTEWHGHLVDIPLTPPAADEGDRVRMLRAFLDRVRRNDDSGADAEHGLLVMRTLAALYKSAETGREVRLAEIPLTV